MKRLACLFALPALLCADWKIVTRTDNFIRTEYFKGSLVRTDSSSVYTTVLDFEHGRQVNWRNDLGQYAIIEWPAEMQPNPSGPAIVIERHTSDTGERKQYLGRASRHLVSHITRSDGPESVIDGWYVDVPGLPKHKIGSGGAIAIMTITVGGRSLGPPRIEMKQVGPPPDGLAVWQKTVSKVAMAGGSSQSHESVSEVTELSERVLPEELFKPPAKYQFVTNLPYADPRPAPRTLGQMIQWHWQAIQDWFSSMF